MTGERCLTGHFHCALAFSVALHLLFGAALTPEFTGSRAQSGAHTVITVQLAAQPAAEMANFIEPQPEIPAAARRTTRPAPAIDSGPHVAMAAPGGGPAEEVRPLTLPAAADPTYYGARDLDVYPRPVAPLELDRIAEGIAAAGRVAVTLQIDEQGTVSNVAFTGPAPDELKEGLRAALAATRFLPARKDGHAVRSRLNLSVDFTQEKREP